MSTAARIAEDSLSSSLPVFVVSNLLLEPLNLLLLPCGEADGFSFQLGRFKRESSLES
jgi:hypothetical protein